MKQRRPLKKRDYSKKKGKKSIIQKFMSRMMRKHHINIRETALVAASVGGLSVALEIKRELSEFIVRRYRILAADPREDADQVTRVRIIFLSDLHGKEYGKDHAELIRAVQREKPDYILIGGDLVTRSKKETDAAALSLVRRLTQICPVYMANGNHEQKMRIDPERYGNRYESYIRAVREAGAHVLESASAYVEMKGVPVQLSGLELPVQCYGHGKVHRLSVSDIRKALGEPDRRCCRILMAHSPVFMPVYREWGADLTLSGHLHGGIIRIPGIGGLITPQARLFPKYSGGIYQEGTHVGVVSRGLGTHTVNLRFCNPAEVVSVLLEFHP